MKYKENYETFKKGSKFSFSLMALTDSNEVKNIKEKKEVVQEEISTESKINHVLIPTHRLISKEEKEALLEKYNITAKQLPKISIKDPVIKSIGSNIKAGEVVEISRSSVTAGETKYYRMIING